ncbi:SDR family NAD(P)-dependent oxidoreductase [Actibacterium sp. MT2.3-13A]|uniref:SDR family NAD(P)-dependent oxidoreductase n=1 Tax=Actibacterium sp. MT2.3-13A TaxID=2828332 RepID=UPI001BAB548A|nr:SDR family NAD(P)-dependent oxidoreductase [Actibacterium sp. MT2.3-13A]
MVGTKALEGTRALIGTRALVIGASGGIGAAVSTALKARGAQVTGLSRRDDGLDVTREETVKARLGSLEGPFDLVFTATGALHGAGHAPEKTFRALESEAMAAQYAVNAVGPAMVLKHAIDLLPRDRRAVIAVLSARVGSIGDNLMGGWYSYRAAKAAVNQLVRTAAIELARTHRQAICVALHPGTVETGFTADFKGRPMVSPRLAARNLLSVIDRLTPEDSGGFYDWNGKRVPW